MPQAPVPKVFRNVDEIDRAIQKLERRVEEIRGLSASRVQWNGPEKRTGEQNVRNAILEIYGPDSPEFRAHQYFEIWHGAHYVMGGGDPPSQFAAGIPEAATTLEGLIAQLREKRADLTAGTAVRAVTSFDSLDLHPRIADVARDLFNGGHYANAVGDAAKALVNYVKERSGRHDLDGATLMRTVFSVNSPILVFGDLKDQSDKDEQEGLMHLFEGAVLGIRNPRSHAFRVDDVHDAVEYLGLLSLLARRVERSRRA